MHYRRALMAGRSESRVRARSPLDRGRALCRWPLAPYLGALAIEFNCDRSPSRSPLHLRPSRNDIIAKSFYNSSRSN
ncbi:MAG: hypothetical protein JGK30_04330 [Microcoleus sp. PH2017_40_RAT_O_B]|uniref:hypothetical protein n=1 Tax=unclassified Microcoleus TaxID=2642155 RepID=UPI001DC8D202|nr:MULTISPECIES: hypothetical protein [unclassified Microcoleus]MCC3608749.1 hypothetical protein [Microcoleus sp. PH2017_40_RAT_O_B]MCC3446930.1 hypothetical protein [Microcoleus sp. PH2017_09_SFU_O_A]MCC3583433.1 hypothetical protein [Microcoleus sp. PH2017_30_WIL_O_A]MCC3627918.1 hypothetical protein [Microcoleus sp. PH2017_39_LGB_O_B]MCC3640020.1 hypothetical protein [Microcoleus sp. PH2017_33_LGB_O_A]